MAPNYCCFSKRFYHSTLAFQVTVTHVISKEQVRMLSLIHDPFFWVRDLNIPSVSPSREDHVVYWPDCKDGETPPASLLSVYRYDWCNRDFHRKTSSVS